jgi:hypothetical protein
MHFSQSSKKIPRGWCKRRRFFDEKAKEDLSWMSLTPASQAFLGISLPAHKLLAGHSPPFFSFLHRKYHRIAEGKSHL